MSNENIGFIVATVLMIPLLSMLIILDKRNKKLRATEVKDNSENKSNSTKKDVFKYYCPKCKRNIPDTNFKQIQKVGLSNVIECSNCCALLMPNRMRAVLNIVGILGMIAFQLLGRTHLISTVLGMSGMIGSLVVIVISISMEKLQIHRQPEGD